MQQKSSTGLFKPNGTNCPNCGAPITGKRCEYCGTVFHSSEYNDHLAKQAALELQANRARMNAMLIGCIQPTDWNPYNPYNPNSGNGYAALQTPQEVIERLQRENMLNSVNVYKK